MLYLSNLCFNPSQVGYKLAIVENNRVGVKRFNPSQVGYKLGYWGSNERYYASFNPSQVGYKLLYGSGVYGNLSLFQSLTGRLQTRGCPPCAVRGGAFQSLTGRLQTSYDNGRRQHNRRFNPSQVGYKRIDKHIPDSALMMFQSLTGRLQTLEEETGCTSETWFQSLTGRLQTEDVEFFWQFSKEFQSLTGRLQTRRRALRRRPRLCFNPSQVGYKPVGEGERKRTRRVSIPHR